MPLIVFNYTSPTALGETSVFRQIIQLDQAIPSGARFYIRQVSAISTDSVNPFRYVRVNIPELMALHNQVQFAQYIVNNNVITPTSAADGFNFYLADLPTASVFPNLSLGRHFISEYNLNLELTAFSSAGVIAPLYSYSVVIEWTTE